MSALEGKTFDAPDETRQFAGHGHLDLVNLESGPVGRAVFEPGWRWSNDVKPIAGTESCEAEHVGYVVSGSMTARMDDGSEHTYRAGDVFHIPPGHDAWTEGDEPCVQVDFSGVSTYAKAAG